MVERLIDRGTDIMSLPGIRGWRVNKNSLAQVENMAGFSKVPITPEQKRLYALLRDTTDLTDQQLFAEVVRLTDEANLDYFMQHTRTFSKWLREPSTIKRENYP